MEKRKKRPAAGPKTVESGVGAAGAALEAEIVRFERLTDAARQLPLVSAKNVDRAARTLAEAAESHGRFGTALAALVEAVGAAKERQRRSADALNTIAVEIGRMKDVHELLAAEFVALGEEAAEVSRDVRGISSAPPGTDTATLLAELDERLGSLSTRAKELSAKAKDSGLADLQKEARSLWEQMESARGRLSKARRTVTN
jgi:hypothetical protein